MASLCPPTPAASESERHLGDPLDLVDDGDGRTALVVLSKTNVPQVQDAGNDSKEILGTREW